MDVERLKEAGINYDDGVKKFAGKAELYERFLLEFLDEPHFAQMIDEINQNDIDSAFKTAHALKGVVGTLGMDDLYQCLFQLVEALRNKEQDKVEVYFAQIQKEYDRVYEGIKG